MFVCVSVCLSVRHAECNSRNGFWSFTLCICTVFHQNAQKTKDANPIVQMTHHHLHDLSKHCSKHVNMHYFCMYTTGETQKPVSKNVKCRLARWCIICSNQFALFSFRTQKDLRATLLRGFFLVHVFTARYPLSPQCVIPYHQLFTLLRNCRRIRLLVKTQSENFVMKSEELQKLSGQVSQSI